MNPWKTFFGLSVFSLVIALFLVIMSGVFAVGSYSLYVFNSTGTINDLSGNARHLSAIGSPTYGCYNGFGACGFSSTDHLRTNPGQAVGNQSTSFGVSTWFLINSTSNGGRQTIVSNNRGSFGAHTWVIQYIGNENRLTAAFYNGTSYNGIRHCDLAEDGNPHSLVYTWNHTSSTSAAWLDGESCSGTSSTPQSDSTDLFVIGARQGSGQPATNMTVFWLAVDNKVVNSSMAADVFQRNYGYYYNPPQGEQITVNYASPVRTIPWAMWTVKDNGASTAPGGTIDHDFDDSVADAGSPVGNFTRLRELKKEMVGYGGGSFKDMFLEWFMHQDNVTLTTRNDINPKNLTNVREDLIWHAQNNMTYGITASFMPDWLANPVNTCGDKSSDQNNLSDCSPNNYTKWYEVYKYSLGVIGCYDYPGTCYLEIPVNEPYSPGTTQFFHDKGTCDQRVSNAINDTSAYLSHLLNDTDMMNALRWIVVGSAAEAAGGTCGAKMANSMRGNFSTLLNTSSWADKLAWSDHDIYSSQPIPGNHSSERIEAAANKYRDSSGRPVFFTEGNFNLGTGTVAEHCFNNNVARYNTHLIWSMGTAAKHPYIVGYTLWPFTLDRNLSVHIAPPVRDPSECQHAVTRPEFNETLNPTMTAMANMSKYFPAETVIVSSSETNNVFVVAGNNSGSHYVLVGNKRDATAFTPVLTLSGLSALNATSMRTGNVYEFEDDVAVLREIPAQDFDVFLIGDTASFSGSNCAGVNNRFVYVSSANSKRYAADEGCLFADSGVLPYIVCSASGVCS